MTTTVVNVWTEAYTVYIGRAVPRRRLARSKWANPFKIMAALRREESFRRYRARLLSSPELLAVLPELRPES